MCVCVGVGGGGVIMSACVLFVSCAALTDSVISETEGYHLSLTISFHL